MKNQKQDVRIVSDKKPQTRLKDGFVGIKPTVYVQQRPYRGASLSIAFGTKIPIVCRSGSAVLGSASASDKYLFVRI